MISREVDWGNKQRLIFVPHGKSPHCNIRDDREHAASKLYQDSMPDDQNLKGQLTVEN